MKQVKFLAFIAIVVSTIVGCTKQDNSQFGIANNSSFIEDAVKEKLTSKRWLLINSQSKIDMGNGYQIIDIYGSLDPCNQDDLTIFETDFTITKDEGAVMCSGNTKQTYKDGNWKLEENGSVIDFSDLSGRPGALDVKAKILKLNATTLEIEYNNSPNMSSANTVSVYKAQ